MSGCERGWATEPPGWPDSSICSCRRCWRRSMCRGAWPMRWCWRCCRWRLAGTANYVESRSPVGAGVVVLGLLWMWRVQAGLAVFATVLLLVYALAVERSWWGLLVVAVTGLAGVVSLIPLWGDYRAAAGGLSRSFCRFRPVPLSQRTECGCAAIGHRGDWFERRRAVAVARAEHGSRRALMRGCWPLAHGPRWCCWCSVCSGPHRCGR